MLGMRSRARRARVVAVGAVVLLTALAAVFASGGLTDRPATHDVAASAGPSTHFVWTAKRAGLPDLPGGTVLFVGASYTAALGASDAEHGYAAVAAHLLGRPYFVAAAPGTGFLNAGPHHEGTFADRIAAVPEDVNPALVIVQGGRNDAGSSAGRIELAVSQTLTAIHDRFPSARVVLLGPILGVTPAGEALQADRNGQRAAATRHSGVGFIDPIAENWITPDNVEGFTGQVPAHPNDAGYNYIAHRLVDDLPGALSSAAAVDTRRVDASSRNGAPVAAAAASPATTGTPTAETPASGS